MSYRLQSRLANKIRENLTQALYLFEYNTIGDSHLSKLLGHEDQTQLDDAWIKSLDTVPLKSSMSSTSASSSTSSNASSSSGSGSSLSASSNAGSSSSTGLKNDLWTKLPVFGYQFPQCNSGTGFDADRLTSPEAFDRFCQGLDDREDDILRSVLDEDDDPMEIDPGEESDYQDTFLNDLAVMLNRMFRRLAKVFQGFGSMKCRVATRQTLRNLLKHENICKQIDMKLDWALLVIYTDENGQTRRILPLVLKCKSGEAKALAGAHLCRDYMAQKPIDRFVVRPGTDDKDQLDNCWHACDFENNRFVEAAEGFYSSIQQAAIPVFLHSGRTYGVTDPAGIFIHQRKKFHPIYREQQLSLAHFKETGWFQRFVREGNNGVPVNNDLPETVPTDSLFVKHLNQNGWRFDIVCMVFKILEDTFSGFRTYMQLRAQCTSQMAPGDKQVYVPRYANVMLNRAVEQSSRAMREFYKRAYDKLCLSIVTNALYQVGQSSTIRRETSTFKFSELLQDGMSEHHDDYNPSTVLRSRHEDINNGNEFVLKVFNLTDMRVDCFLNEVHALQMLNKKRGMRKYWPGLYEFGYIHGLLEDFKVEPTLEDVKVKHADIFLYVAMEYISSIGTAGKDEELAIECKAKLEEAGVKHLDWTPRHLLVCHDARGVYCRAIDYGMSEITVQNGNE